MEMTRTYKVRGTYTTKTGVKTYETTSKRVRGTKRIHLSDAELDILKTAVLSLYHQNPATVTDIHNTLKHQYPLLSKHRTGRILREDKAAKDENELNAIKEAVLSLFRQNPASISCILDALKDQYPLLTSYRVGLIIAEEKERRLLNSTYNDINHNE